MNIIDYRPVSKLQPLIEQKIKAQAWCSKNTLVYNSNATNATQIGFYENKLKSFWLLNIDYKADVVHMLIDLEKEEHSVWTLHLDPKLGPG